MNTLLLALGLKFAFTAVCGLLTLALFDDITWLAVFGWAAAAAAVNYFLGDRRVLPSLGSPLAAMADGIIGAVLAWIFGSIFTGFRTTGATLIALAALIALAEYFFHVLLRETSAASP